MANGKKVFTKTVSLEGAVSSEVEGLGALSIIVNQHAIEEINIPVVNAYSESSITLEYIDCVQPSRAHYERLAEGLAKLHLVKQSNFGWHRNNFIGGSIQVNQLTDNWGRFFVEKRLMYQVSLLADESIRTEYQTTLENNQRNIESFLSATTSSPSLVHGDLWQGNALYSGRDKVWLIDPAVYYGDREVDIAMTELFGGFSNAFYQHYRNYAGLSEQYPLKKQVYNLYHNLNHLNLFGRSYQSACDNGMQTLTTI